MRKIITFLSFITVLISVLLLINAVISLINNQLEDMFISIIFTLCIIFVVKMMTNKDGC